MATDDAHTPEGGGDHGTLRRTRSSSWLDEVKINMENQFAEISSKLLRAGFVVVAPPLGSPANQSDKGDAKKRKNKKVVKRESPPSTINEDDPLNLSVVVIDDPENEDDLSNVLSKMTNLANSRGSSAKNSDHSSTQYEPSSLLSEIPVINDIHEFFQPLDQLGSGSFGKVCRAKCIKKCPSLSGIAVGDMVALKVLEVNPETSDDEDEKTPLDEIEDPTEEEKESAEKEFLHEYEILKRLKDNSAGQGGHPNILHLLGAGVTPARSGFFLITEVCAGPLVFDHIIQDKHLCEWNAREIARHILRAIEFCHANRIAHRDIKPENLLFSKPLESVDEMPPIKLIDFGCAMVTTDGTMSYDMAGTPWYIAPEIIFSPIRRRSAMKATKIFRHQMKHLPMGKSILACDMWSFGVVVFLLLTGRFPFFEASREELYSVICRGSYSFSAEESLAISREAQDFISKLLRVEWDRRMTATQALEHSWLKMPGEFLPQSPFSQNYFDNLEKNQIESKKKKRVAVNSAIFSNKIAEITKSHIG
eukprot:TRINITY_DN3639_c0_g1_i3.p1 TRINITY_DN3639_c0_g1~~TRINITY_DN3639_c0_g1_i3.p1  ORF type:complete len:604 (-),score=108.07 TRINITY_DN3639_c0_g1_i3:40-1641(-)